MALNISRLINFFFKKDKIFENLEPNLKEIMELFEPTYNILKSKYITWKNDPQLVVKMEKLNKVNSELEAGKLIQEILKSFLQDETVIESILNIIEIFFDNLEEIFLNIPGIDKALYKSFTQFLILISKHNNIKLKELTTTFYANIFKEIDLFTIIGSILIFHEKREFEEVLGSTDEIEYKKYLSDWTLKYAQVIEGPLKNALLLLLKLKNISLGNTYNNLDEKNVSIGYILKRLNADYLLANYRNSIFHQNIYFNKEHKIENKKIILIDRGVKIVLNLEDFIKEFYKVLIFLITFYLVIFNNYLEFFNQPKQVINKILVSVKDIFEDFISKSDDSYLLDFHKILRNEE